MPGMELAYPPEAEAFREKVQAFLSEHLPTNWEGIGMLDNDEAEDFTERWVELLADNHLRAPPWPKEYGGSGLSEIERVVLSEEFTKAGVPLGNANDSFGIWMMGPTLMTWGTEEQKSFFLPKILSGEHRWCQGFSEPGAGSDLANLGCRAVLDGDEWVINGQKVWTSAGHLANWIFALCRTDPDVPKHRGISLLMVDMRQPGVDVRPLRMLAGPSEFNEVFFTDARTPANRVLGGINNGWAVAMTLLGHERGGRATTLPLLFRAELHRLLALARERGRDKDPLVRQRLAWCYARVEIMRFQGMRTLTRILAGSAPGADAAISKLFWSEYHKAVTELATDIIGADAMTPTGRHPRSAFYCDEPGSPNSSASWVGTFLSARAGTIYSGTSEIQRNIIGEQLLGLPKEPRADEGPWKHVPRAASS
jgi:alkylation response protein AidB-like acyl-CoA dehydrogenase